MSAAIAAPAALTAKPDPSSHIAARSPAQRAASSVAARG